MAREPDSETSEEASRLETALRLMTRTRQATCRGQGALDAMLASHGLGEWTNASHPLRSAAFACRLCRTEACLEAFGRLLRRVEAHAGRLLYRPCGESGSYLLPLQGVARAHPSWKREPEGWRPRTGSAEQQFTQLVRYLIGDQETPPPAPVEGLPEPVRPWFPRVGSPEDPLTAPGGPFPLTRRMAYHLLEASRRHDLVRALRAAQVRALGGGESLVRALLHSRLGAQVWDREEEAWWLGVVHWLVNHPELGPEQVGPVVEYLCARRYGDPEHEKPPDPDFAMRGRAPAVLLRLVEEWERLVAIRQERRVTEFPRSGLRPGQWTLTDGEQAVIWKLEEILDSAALEEEGWRMRHCAATYAGSIRRGKYSFWSLQRVSGGVSRRALTVQADLCSLRVVQYRGIGNRSPRDAERDLVSQWADENGLLLGR